MFFSVDTKVRGRFSEKRCGPSRRCARNASAALENFVCYPQKTFSTASVKLRRTHCEQIFSALPPRPDIAPCSRHVRNVPQADVTTCAEKLISASVPSADEKRMVYPPINHPPRCCVAN